ncbi:PucR family transcriptional regulator [Nocardia niigatensis]|uniref:PucR family transcriptional regulator n=1 Tax=Nocardia niigatensis TaxID=209249 RepID=UPI00059293BD|nr:helix-turn-helix domain-containing protein [Nocardia niigatensis]
MDIEWPPARQPTAERVWREVLRPIAVEMRLSAGELAARAVARMQDELPELFPDTQTVTENLVSTEASLRQLAQVMEIGADPQQLDLPPSTLAIARSGVRRQVALADLMRFYRLAQEQVWKWILDRITVRARDASEQATAIRLATEWIFAYADGAMIRAERAYEVERETWWRTAAAARAVAIEEILEGGERDGHRASAQLRYEVIRHHIGVIAWVEQIPQDGDVLPALNDSVAGFARAVGAESTLVQPMGSLAVMAWVSRRGAFSAADLDNVRRHREMRDLPAGVKIALGEPNRALDGFRRSHIQAAHARRIASMVGPHGDAVTRYRDIAVAALGTADGDHALAFITAALGPLAADDDATYRLAMTLAVFLDENGSRIRAAERLNVHPNTVAYRVRQAEELLGRGIDTGTLELRVALALLPALPGLTHPRPTAL